MILLLKILKAFAKRCLLATEVDLHACVEPSMKVILKPGIPKQKGLLKFGTSLSFSPQEVLKIEIRTLLATLHGGSFGRHLVICF